MAATAIIENNSISTRIMPNVIDDNNSTSVEKTKNQPNLQKHNTIKRQPLGQQLQEKVHKKRLV